MVSVLDYLNIAQDSYRFPAIIQRFPHDHFDLPDVLPYSRHYLEP